MSDDIVSLNSRRETPLDDPLLVYRNAIHRAFPQLPQDSMAFYQAVRFSEVLKDHHTGLLGNFLKVLQTVADTIERTGDYSDSRPEEEASGLYICISTVIRIGLRHYRVKGESEVSLELIDLLLDPDRYTQ